MDDTGALYGGAAASRWARQHPKHKILAQKIKKRRAAQDAREAGWDKGQRCRERVARYERETELKKKRRKRMVRKIEREDRKEFRKRRKAEGYTKANLPYKDLVGRRFGRLTVIRPGGHNPSGSKRWWVRCDCGSAEKEIAGTNLKQGILRSCGCLRGEGARRYSRRVRLKKSKRLRRQIRGGVALWKRWFIGTPSDQKLVQELIKACVWAQAELKKARRQLFDKRGKPIKAWRKNRL